MKFKLLLTMVVLLVLSCRQNNNKKKEMRWNYYGNDFSENGKERAKVPCRPFWASRSQRQSTLLLELIIKMIISRRIKEMKQKKRS